MVGITGVSGIALLVYGFVQADGTCVLAGNVLIALSVATYFIRRRHAK
jgi:hypothetical protein